jgi:MurNAc alpha-1-phosphate uridylyltransferase
MIDTIILFSAGLGTRMRHLTQDMPKPLLPILGKPILHYVFDVVQTYPFKRIIINTHYLHKKIEEEVEIIKKLNPNLPEIIISYEPELLNTGGTVKNAYKIIGDNPIFTMNCDCLFFPDEPIFQNMVKIWDSEKMNFLLLSYPVSKAIGYKGEGDFDILPNNTINRPKDLDIMPYMYTGIQILKPKILSENIEDKFSLGAYYLDGLGNNIYTYLFQGQWCHASSPEDIIDIENYIKQRISKLEN